MLLKDPNNPAYELLGIGPVTGIAADTTSIGPTTVETQAAVGAGVQGTSTDANSGDLTQRAATAAARLRELKATLGDKATFTEADINAIELVAGRSQIAEGEISSVLALVRDAEMRVVDGSTSSTNIAKNEHETQVTYQQIMSPVATVLEGGFSDSIKSLATAVAGNLEFTWENASRDKLTGEGAYVAANTPNLVGIGGYGRDDY